MIVMKLQRMTKTNRHWHKSNTTKDLIYVGRCVGMRCNSSSHEGITRIEYCICGMHRQLNIKESKRWKQTYKEYGSWVRGREE